MKSGLKTTTTATKRGITFIFFKGWGGGFYSNNTLPIPITDSKLAGNKSTKGMPNKRFILGREYHFKKQATVEQARNEI